VEESLLTNHRLTIGGRAPESLGWRRRHIGGVHPIPVRGVSEQRAGTLEDRRSSVGRAFGAIKAECES